jgi:hypothetical protein
MSDSTSRFLRGAYPFEGIGYHTPAALDAALVYVVPSDRRAQFIYFRGGNSSAELVNVVIMHDGEPMRMFPIGAKAAIHVTLAVVEDLMPDTRLAVFFAAPRGVAGTLIVDIGLIEI